MEGLPDALGAAGGCEWMLEGGKLITPECKLKSVEGKEQGLHSEDTPNFYQTFPGTSVRAHSFLHFTPPSAWLSVLQYCWKPGVLLHHFHGRAAEQAVGGQ